MYDTFGILLAALWHHFCIFLFFLLNDLAPPGILSWRSKLTTPLGCYWHRCGINFASFWDIFCQMISLLQEP